MILLLFITYWWTLNESRLSWCVTWIIDNVHSISVLGCSSIENATNKRKKANWWDDDVRNWLMFWLFFSLNVNKYRSSNKLRSSARGALFFFLIIELHRITSTHSNHQFFVLLTVVFHSNIMHSRTTRHNSIIDECKRFDYFFRMKKKIISIEILFFTEIFCFCNFSISIISTNTETLF